MRGPRVHRPTFANSLATSVIILISGALTACSGQTHQRSETERAPVLMVPAPAAAGEGPAYTFVDGAAADSANDESQKNEPDEQAQTFDERFPNHGVTRHFLARVRSAPNISAPVAGYMRRGSRFRASERVPGVGCAHGWFEVPGAGYVCRGEAFRVDDTPPSYDNAPIPPALDDPLPYRYAVARGRAIPQFWRVPSEAEEARGRELIAELTAQERREADEENVEAPPAPGMDEEVDSRPSAAQLSASFPAYIRQRMLPGFVVSIDEEIDSERGAFTRTVRGGFVRTDRLDYPEASAHHGVVLGGAWRMPIAFTIHDGTHRLQRIGTSERFESAGTLSRQTPFRIAEMTDLRGSSYLVDFDGYTVRRSAVRIAAAMPRPARVRETDQWIHISLSEQTLVAYEGDTPVYATLVSTGKRDHETPVGLFRIQSKHVSTTMDDLTSTDGAYQIEDVPWTMYFEGNYALHTAFWHDRFGQTRSHGCVNLAPSDARWIFHWSTPELPPSWHGVFSEGDRVATWVHVTEE